MPIQQKDVTLQLKGTYHSHFFYKLIDDLVDMVKLRFI
jgi:hypothetical protein